MKPSFELSEKGKTREDAIASDVSSTSNAVSSLDLSSSEIGDEDGKPGCLKDSRCLREGQHCLKDRACLKYRTCLKGHASTISDSSDTGTDSDACLKSQLCKNARNISSAERDRARAPPGSTGTTSHSGDASEEAMSSSRASKGKSPRSSSSGSTSSEGGQEAWTLSQDCALRAMKESGDGMSWADIAEALGRPRNDVKARWKWIQAYLAGAEEKRNSQSSDMKRTEGDKTEKAAEAIDTANGKGNASPSLLSPKKNDGGQAAPVRVSGHPKGDQKRTTSHVAAGLGMLSGEEASSEPSVSGDTAQDSEDEARRQDRYLHETLRGELYPPHASIRPDASFGPRDCQILAAAESRHHRSKWLEMQANFYNATGRMVPLELIRAKCERAERERFLDAQPAMRGGHKVQQWMRQLETEGGPE